MKLGRVGPKYFIAPAIEEPVAPPGEAQGIIGSRMLHAL
jgi:hypothetical protein